jgi:hypothetical protein
MLGRHLWVAIAFSVLAFVLACEGLASPNFAMAQEPLGASCDQYRCAEQEPPAALESETEIVPPFTQPPSETNPPTLPPAPVPTADLVPSPDGTIPAGDDESTEQALETLEKFTVVGNLSDGPGSEDDEGIMPDESIPPEDAEEGIGPKDYPGFVLRDAKWHYYEEDCGDDDCGVQADHPSYFVCRKYTKRQFSNAGKRQREESEVVCTHPQHWEWMAGGVPKQWEDKQCLYFYNANGEQTSTVRHRCTQAGPSEHGARDAADDAERVDGTPTVDRSSGDDDSGFVALRSIVSFVESAMSSFLEIASEDDDLDPESLETNAGVSATFERPEASSTASGTSSEVFGSNEATGRASDNIEGIPARERTSPAASERESDEFFGVAGTASNDLQSGQATYLPSYTQRFATGAIVGGPKRNHGVATQLAPAQSSSRLLVGVGVILGTGYLIAGGTVLRRML